MALRRIRSNSSWLSAVVTAVVAVTMTGCASAATPAALEPPPYSVEATLAAFRGYLIDYDPRRSPDELAQNSSLVVSGTVGGMREGRRSSVVGSGVDDDSTITLILRDVVVGEAQPGTGDPMFIELVNPSNMAPEDYGTALPTGTAVVAYLMPAFDGVAAPGTDIEIKQPEEGRPTGQPLYQPSGPQAFVVQASPSDDVVWPLIGAHQPGAIAEAMPGGTLIAAK